MSGGDGITYEFYVTLKKTFEAYKETLYWLIMYSDGRVPRMDGYNYNKRLLPLVLWKKIWEYAGGRELNGLTRRVKEKLFERFPSELYEKFEGFCLGCLAATSTTAVPAVSTAVSAKVIKVSILEKALQLGVSATINQWVVQSMLNEMTHDQLKVMQQHCGIVLRPLQRDRLEFGKTIMVNIHDDHKETFLLLREDSQHFAILQSTKTRKCVYMDRYGFDVKTGAHFKIFRVVSSKTPNKESLVRPAPQAALVAPVSKRRKH